MSIKYTKQYLSKLEDIFLDTDYILRYEKGNFQSGYCILNDTKIAIINKYFSLDGKINSIIDILRTINLDKNKLSEKNRILVSKIQQNQLQIWQSLFWVPVHLRVFRLLLATVKSAFL